MLTRNTLLSAKREIDIFQLRADACLEGGMAPADCAKVKRAAIDLGDALAVLRSRDTTEPVLMYDAERFRREAGREMYGAPPVNPVAAAVAEIDAEDDEGEPHKFGGPVMIDSIKPEEPGDGVHTLPSVDRPKAINLPTDFLWFYHDGCTHLIIEESFRNDVQRQGIYEPLRVRKSSVDDEPSKYEVLDGKKRLTAARDLYITPLPCVIVTE